MNKPRITFGAIKLKATAAENKAEEPQTSGNLFTKHENFQKLMF